MNICILNYQFNHEIGYLLQQYNESCWLSVVVRVGPDEADGVEESRDPLLQLKEITLLHLFKLTSDRLQMHTGGGGGGGGGCQE